MAKITYKKWLVELQEIFSALQKNEKYKFRGSKKFWDNYVATTGADSWKDYWKDGAEPSEAVATELSYMAEG